MNIALRGALAVAALASLAACGSSPATAPSPSPTPLAGGLDPCTLISAAEVSQITGVTFGGGQPEVFHGLQTGSEVAQDGPGCGFTTAGSATAPTPGPDGLSPVPDGNVEVTLISRQAYNTLDFNRGIGPGTHFVHPLSLSGADAAVELAAPDLAIVYARRGTVCFRVDVQRGKGSDASSEERIAATVLSHLH